MGPRIAKDKKRHFYLGILMGIVLEVTALWLFAGQPVAATAVTLLVVIAISYGFELFSKFSGMGVYDFADAVASVLGGVIGMAVGFAGLVYLGS